MVDLKPTEAMREAARKGLEYRREYGRGGTAVGIARARDISNGKNLSPDTVRRMKAFFDRHQQNRVPPSQKKMPDGGPTNGWIAWLLWGGDPGRSWAERKVKELERSGSMETKTMSTKVEREAGMPENRFRAVITDGTVDRYGTSFDPYGADVRNYMKNPVVYLKHDRSNLPIGHATQLKLTNDGRWEAEFEIDGVTELERIVIAKLNAGTLNAVSIGAVVNPQRTEKGKDGVITFREWELLEFSVVDIPGNPEAIVTAREWSEVVNEHCTAKGIELEEVMEERIGKKLSRKNEELLRSAFDALRQVLEAGMDEESEVEEDDEQDRPYDEDEEEERSAEPADYVESLMYELEARDLQPVGLESILEDYLNQ